MALLGVLLALALPLTAGAVAESGPRWRDNWHPALIALRSWALTPQAAAFGAGPDSAWGALAHVDFDAARAETYTAPFAKAFETVPLQSRLWLSSAMKRCRPGEDHPLSPEEARRMM